MEGGKDIQKTEDLPPLSIQMLLSLHYHRLPFGVNARQNEVNSTMLLAKLPFTKKILTLAHCRPKSTYKNHNHYV